MAYLVRVMWVCSGNLEGHAPSWPLTPRERTRRRVPLLACPAVHDGLFPRRSGRDGARPSTWQRTRPQRIPPRDNGRDAAHRSIVGCYGKPDKS